MKQCPVGRPDLHITGTKAPGIRFCSCSANRYVDFHHILHWAEFGETEPDNLIKLCRFHHAQLHKGHYTIALQQQTEKNYGQKWVFKTAAGEVMEPNPTLPISKQGPIGKDFLAAQWPNITSRTGVSRRPGELKYLKARRRDSFRCKHQQQVAHRSNHPR